ncbi:MAG: methyltransferase domain-containing protein [Egibacteraceae bacterium]
MSHAEEYLLGVSDAERERLLKQGEVHRAEAEWLLKQVGAKPGWRAIDVGCGPLGLLDLLVQAVGPSGVVVGLDREPRMLEMAARSVAERNLDVELCNGEATDTKLPGESFDLVHERLVLINTPSPEVVVAEMARLAGPGGWVALQELDFVSWVCEPPHPAWDRVYRILIGLWQSAGMDPFIGRRLPDLLRRAGLEDVQVQTHAHVWGPGDLYQTFNLHLVSAVRERILASGALTAATLDGLVSELAAHLEQPGTLVLHPTFFQAWGRRP